MDQDLFPDRQFNISDIIEVIQSSDPAYAAANMPATYNNEGPLLTQQPMDIAAGSTVDMEMEMKKKAYVKILEQPASKALRFRYECEGRSAGSIPGAKSSPEKKTFPKIQVVGYRGPAVVVVSCVTKDPPHRPHPHNLVGKEGCKKGVCTMEINSEEMTTEFSNLGIQCVKRKDLEEALRVREEIRVDPFQTGFSHRAQPTSIDLNALRLCFQVFLEGAEKRRFTLPLKPVLSDTIFDKKAMCDLVICKLSDCSCSVAGDKEIILLCDKVTKDDVQVRFYEERDGLLYWEDFGDFQPSDVHKQVAISFRAPRYKHMDIERPVTVSIQLLRPTDKQTSESRPFQYLPLSTGRPLWSSMRKLKGDYSVFSSILSANSASTFGRLETVQALPAKVTEDTEEDVIIIDDVKNFKNDVDQHESEPQNFNAAPDVSVEREPSIDSYEAIEISNESNTEKTLEDLMRQAEAFRAINDVLDSNTSNGALTAEELIFTIPPTADEAHIFEQCITDDTLYQYGSFQLAMKNSVLPELPNYIGREFDLNPPITAPKPLRPETLRLTTSQPELSTIPPPLPPKRLKRLLSITDQTSPLKEKPPKSPSKPGFFQKLFKRSPTSSEVKKVKEKASPTKKASPTRKPPGNKLPPPAPQITDNTNASNNNNIMETDNDCILKTPVDNVPLPDFADDMSNNLTEAENYALYMGIAPTATTSEFDEASLIYRAVQNAPLEDEKGNKKRLSFSNLAS